MRRDPLEVRKATLPAAVPVGMSWMWTLGFRYHEDCTPTHGYEPTREAAMAAFAKSWRREQASRLRDRLAWSPALPRDAPKHFSAEVFVEVIKSASGLGAEQ